MRRNTHRKNSKIEIEAKRIRDTIQFSVADEGQGIAETEREMVFQKFYRADNTAKGLEWVWQSCAALSRLTKEEIWIEESRQREASLFLIYP